MLTGVKRELGPDNDKAYHIVEAETGRGLILFCESGIFDSIKVSDVPSHNLGFLSQLPSNNYFRKDIPDEEFERAYKKASGVKGAVFLGEGSNDAYLISPREIPSLDHLVHGNFVDLIMEQLSQ
jgi:hypothetical protein